MTQRIIQIIRELYQFILWNIRLVVPSTMLINGNVPCSLCEATGRGDKIMIPSHYVCPDGWHKEYNGYIMAGNYNQEGNSMYYCLDENLEQIKGTGGGDYGYDLWAVYATGLYVPCDGNYALSCVVCTK